MENIPEGYGTLTDDKQILTHEEETEATEPVISSEDSDSFRRYAELIAERDEVEESIKALGVQIKGKMEKMAMQRAFLPGWGSFSVILVPRYKYTEAITKAEEGIKSMKERERTEGIAEKQATTSLRYTPAK